MRKLPDWMIGLQEEDLQRDHVAAERLKELECCDFVTALPEDQHRAIMAAITRTEIEE